jgi:transposase
VLRQILKLVILENLIIYASFAVGGSSQREISQILQVGLSTVNKDISYLRNQAKTNI